jgi:hypothetical protein
MSRSHACRITLDGGVAPEPTISAMFCCRCGYNLHGLPENRCGECGRAFDPKNRKSYCAYSSSPSTHTRCPRFPESGAVPNSKATT